MRRWALGRKRFKVGDRVRVSGGYDQDPQWLRGGSGYVGTITEVVGDHATVELDEVLELQWGSGRGGFEDFGEGSKRKLGRNPNPSGKWLALMHAWEDQKWVEPIGRLHVGLCSTPPVFENMPRWGGIGVWVESHASMVHLSPDE